MRGLIVAAGMGSRLWPITRQMPKTLLPFGDSTILGTILTNFASVGITAVDIVVGFRSDLIEGYLKQSGLGGALDLALLENMEWKRGNGLSVLAARDRLAPGEFRLLSMSDHLVHPRALTRLLDAERSENLLLTDPGVDAVRDIDDATKVMVDDHRIEGIGKTLDTFNAVDCGVFRIDARFMEALETAVAAGEESISAAARILAGAGEFASVGIPPDAAWVDIDTPEDYEYALTRADTYVSGEVTTGGESRD